MTSDFTRETTTLECPFCGQSFTVREHRVPIHEPPPGSDARRYRASTRCFGSGNRLGVPSKKRACAVCGRNKTVLDDGQLIEHTHDGERCAGGRRLPNAGGGAEVAPVVTPPTHYRQPPVDGESGNSVRTVGGGLPSTGRRRR